MTTISLVFKEILHRKINSLLALLAVATAVALVISFFTASKAAERETARLMLSLGYNLHIISKHTDMNDFLLTGIPDKTMPQECLEKLAHQQGISYNHLLASLQRRISWRGFEIVLTGLAPEVCPPGIKKPPMVTPVEPGTVYVGYVLANKLGLDKGDTIEIKGKSLKVAKCLFEQGGIDDIRVQCHLKDAQEILDEPGQISEIRAVDCLCFAPTDDPAAILKREIASILPEAQVFQIKPIATARAKQRQMIRNLFALIVPFVVVACGVWVGVLAITNVRDRQSEIGIMRALGYGSGKITTLFLGRAIVVGLFGAILGFGIGTGLALRFGPDIFKITAKTMIRPDFALLLLSVLFAPLFAAVSSFIPTMIGVTFDPAVTLRE